MPKWEIHDKWAEKAGISKEVSNFVNLLIDFPQKSQEFMDFCDTDPSARIRRRGRPTRMTIASEIKHDSGRRHKYIRETQLKFLSQKGGEYIKAWYLHQILDYIGWWVTVELTPDIEDILQEKRLDKKIGSPQDQDLGIVLSFSQIPFSDFGETSTQF